MRPIPDQARCMSPAGCPLAIRCRRTALPPADMWRFPFVTYPGGRDCYGFLPEDDR